MIVHQAKPKDFAGTLVLRPLNNSSRVSIFAVEQPGKESALTTPIEVPNPKLDAKGKKFFAEGTQLSQALIDTGFQLDVKDVEDEADRVRCTVISLRVVKIQTSEKPAAGSAFVFKEDDDFAPRLNEKAKVHAIIEGNLPGFAGTVRAHFGRLTNRPNKATTLIVDESFTLVATVDKAITAAKAEVEIEWDGKATVAAPREFSDRKTKNQNTGANINIPMAAVTSGQPIPHGIYVIDQLTLLQGSEVLAIHRPDKADLSVPILVNLNFNANWATDLAAFGLTPFQSDIEKALLRFGGRDYMIRDPNLANRMNARYISDNSIGNADSILNSVGGSDTVAGNLGLTPNQTPPPFDNMFAIREGLGLNISVFPSTFFFFNNTPNISDRTAFRAVYAPVGVQPGQTLAAPGVAAPRSVSAGIVTGACAALDKNNVTVTLNDDGIPTVVTTNPGIVPPARARDIQAALNAFIHMVGNTTNHETGHGLGLLARKHPSNVVTISGVSVTTPVNGDNGAHNLVVNTTNIMDAGGTRRFPRRIEAAGNPQQTFNAANAQYLRDVIPFDKNDN